MENGGANPFGICFIWALFLLAGQMEVSGERPLSLACGQTAPLKGEPRKDGNRF